MTSLVRTLLYYSTDLLYHTEYYVSIGHDRYIQALQSDLDKVALYKEAYKTLIAINSAQHE